MADIRILSLCPPTENLKVSEGEDHGTADIHYG
jgi:hypothetical protein